MEIKRDLVKLFLEEIITRALIAEKENKIYLDIIDSLMDKVGECPFDLKKVGLKGACKPGKVCKQCIGDAVYNRVIAKL